MLSYKKYKITNTDSFRPEDFPKVTDELDNLNKNLASITEAYKKDIIISFLKKHSIKTDWILANPDVTSLISSGVFATGHLESLFNSCEGNKKFRQQYEDYIRESIN